MAKYRKKPVVIEAFQWTGGPDQTEDPVWIVSALKEGKVKVLDSGTKYITMCIKTLEGDHFARPGDYIIKGVKNELYPCKPDIFAMTYESAGEANDNSLDEIIQICEKLLPFVDDGLSVHIEKIWGLAKSAKE